MSDPDITHPEVVRQLVPDPDTTMGRVQIPGAQVVLAALVVVLQREVIYAKFKLLTNRCKQLHHLMLLNIISKVIIVFLLRHCHTKVTAKEVTHMSVAIAEEAEEALW